MGFGLMAAPFHEDAVGPPREYAVDLHGIACAQRALIVAARDIESGAEAVLARRAVAAVGVHRREPGKGRRVHRSPMVAVVGEPGARKEAPG